MPVSKSVHIEFIGTAASGKSSVSRALEDVLRKDGSRVVFASTREIASLGKCKRYFYPIGFALRNKKTARSLFFIVFYCFLLFPLRKIEIQNYYLLVVSFLLKNYHENNKEKSIFIFGGEASLIVNLPIHRLGHKSLDFFIDTLYIHDVARVFIFVKTPMEVTIKRAYGDYMENRVEAKLRPEIFYLDAVKRELFYKKSLENQERLIGIFRQKGEGFTIIIIDGTKNPLRNAEHIAQIVKRINHDK